MPDMEFAITVSVLDCTGCASCANVCPGRKGEKALVMTPLEEKLEEQKSFDYGFSDEKPEVSESSRILPLREAVLKHSIRVSGACAGCGETPYAKLVTQLFGERMLIANATDVHQSGV